MRRLSITLSARERDGGLLPVYVGSRNDGQLARDRRVHDLRGDHA